MYFRLDTFMYTKKGAGTSGFAPTSAYSWPVPTVHPIFSTSAMFKADQSVVRINGTFESNSDQL